MVYSFFGGIYVDCSTRTADEIIRRNTVVVSQQSTDACIPHVSWQLCSDVELISTQSYHSRRAYSVTTCSVETKAVTDLTRSLAIAKRP